jgi:retron-type reverse transcriptase
MPQITAKPLIQNGRIALDPSPDGDMIHQEPALRHHLLQISVAERVPQIPPDAQNDDDFLEVPPPEQRRPLFGHRITLPDPPTRVCNRSREAGREGTEASRAMNGTENPASTSRLMEEVCERENLKAALRRVKANKGSRGVDGMTVAGIKDYLKQHWPAIREQLLSGTYEPKPVRRVEIAKPDGGVRKLGIPTVLDRFIHQAVMQVLQRRWDRTFSDHSYGFRPGRSAQQAVAQAQQYIAEGHGWCIDLDLKKFFDPVNHDKLMGQVAKRVEDKRLLKLIRAFLNAGVMENGLVSPSVEGTPQGGPLSPLLSNLVLDEFDRELERRGHRFVRYADDSAPRAQRAEEGPMCVTAGSMREGPSEPAGRSRFQTTFSGCGQKPWS